MSIKDSLSINQSPITEDEGFALISSLKPYSTELIIDRKKYLLPKSKFVYFVIDGHLAISMHKNRKIIDYAFRYMPIGFIENIPNNTALRYQAFSSVRILEVPLSALDMIYNSNQLHLTKSLICLKSGILTSLLSVYNERCTSCAYKTIKTLIERYNKEPLQTEGIASYILQRTHLSKAYVFSTLSALRASGILIMSKGRVVKITGELPEKLSTLRNNDLN